MYRPSVSLVLCGLFIAYIGHSIWTIYSLYTPPVCKPTEECLLPYLQNKPKLMLALFSSTRKTVSSANELSLLREWEDIDIKKTFDITINVTLPRSTINNGSLYVHGFLIPKFQTSQLAAHLISSPYAYYASAPLTAHVVPEAETYQLLGGGCKDGENCTKEKPEKLAKPSSKPVTHWRRKLQLGVMDEMISIPARQIPVEFFKYIRLSPQRQYLPILYIDVLSSRVRDFELLSKTASKVELEIHYAPVSFGKLRLCNQVEAALETMTSLGFTETDLDEIKGIFMDTNLWLLCLTFAVAALHLLFDFLAFKNDILFWHRRKTTVGLSTRSLIWRCVSHVIIFVSLMDGNTSLLIVIPAGVGTIIEMWKLTKVFKVSLSFNQWHPRIQFGTTTEAEQKTELYDAQSMKYLLWLLAPLCVGGAFYSLIYLPHKGWYSWCVQSLVNGVYAFGFLFMLPQLFVNYKHKSVAHLPWKAFMYKAFNTFIDDVFAFIITMPVAHRVACFRDDVVFLIYLYQRWLYPVDKLRVNEFGETFAEKEIKADSKKDN